MLQGFFSGSSQESLRKESEKLEDLLLKRSKNMNGKRMNKSFKRTIYLAAMALLFIAIEACLVFGKKQAVLQDSRTAFEEAVKTECSLTNDFYVSYDSSLATDTIFLTEKIDYSRQFYLMKKDSTRSRLDSLFRKELAGRNLSLPTAIHCQTRDGKYIAASVPIGKEYVEVGEMNWRFNYNMNSDIILQAYIQLPLLSLINQWYTYVWLLLVATGYCLLLCRKRKGKTVEAAEVIPPRTVIPEPTAAAPPGVQICEGYYWEEKTHTLRHAGKSIQLRGNNARLMVIFLKNRQDFLITYQQMIKIYDIKDADRIKERAYQTITQLRSALKELDISIVSVRGTGYQLRFCCSTESGRENQDS